MKKYIILLILLLSASITPIGATQPVRVVIAAPEEMHNYIKEMNILLAQRHPELQLEIWPIRHGSLFSALKANGENIPNIAFLDKQSLPFFAASAIMTDLRPEPFRVLRIRKHMAYHTWDQSELLLNRRRIIGVPLLSGPRCAYWHRESVNSVGIDPTSIRTMDELFVAAGKLTRDTDGDGKVDHWFIGSASEIAWMIIDSSFQKYFDGKGQILVENTLFQEAFHWALRFQQAGYTASTNPGSSQWINTIKNGKVAYSIADDTTGEVLRRSLQKNSTWIVTKCPSRRIDTKPMSAMAHGWWLCIPQKAKHKAAAWTVIKYLATDPQAVMAFSKMTGGIPAYMGVWDDPHFSEAIDIFDGQQARLLWIEISRETPNYRANVFDGIASHIVASELDQVLYQNKPITKALSQAKRRINRDIKKALREKSN